MGLTTIAALTDLRTRLAEIQHWPIDATRRAGATRNQHHDHDSVALPRPGPAHWLPASGAVGFAAGGAARTAAAVPAVTVTSTERNRTAPKAAAAAAKPKPAAASIADGTYRVPQDVKPGTYRTGGPGGGNCYWARLNGLGGSLDDVIANRDRRRADDGKDCPG